MTNSEARMPLEQGEGVDGIDASFGEVGEGFGVEMNLRNPGLLSFAPVPGINHINPRIRKIGHIASG